MFAHLFPPLGGSGVQRTLKHVKYLPMYGFDPIVIERCVDGASSLTRVTIAVTGTVAIRSRTRAAPAQTAH